ncbi:MAG: uL30 family ribosomal protein [Candidatus Anstonellales archaeon]
MEIDELNGKVIAIVRVRGIRKIKPKIARTLSALRLNRVNHAVVVKANPQYIGMLKVAKDYITFGEVKKETVEKLVEKRGEVGKKRATELLKEKDLKKIVDEIFDGKKPKVLSPVFRLHAPRRGWKSIKLAYPRGALGIRDNMDEILSRMM